MASSTPIHAPARQRAGLPAAPTARVGAALTRIGETALVVALLIVGMAAHAVNMFDFPAFSFNGDEGIYTGQALAVLYDGQLAPYTYWYDHAPAGWILMAAWMALSGGPPTLGRARQCGR